MTQFTIRVELHDATWSDYAELHEQMRKQGFRQTIRADDGRVYELPPAEYSYEGEVSRSDLLNKAKQAAAQVKVSYAILVTQSAGATWYGLKSARAAA